MDRGTYKITELWRDALRGFEGLRLTAYECAGGVWTIGYGHTRGVKEGDTITGQEAEELLTEDMRNALDLLEGADVTLSTQGQVDALADFIYNLGIGSFLRSTLLRKIKAGAGETEIRAEFRKWVYGGGVKLDGLVKRRQWEEDRYFSVGEVLER